MSCLFKANRILKMPDVYKLRVGTMMYRITKLNEMPLLRQNLEIRYPDQMYSSRRPGQLVTPFARTDAIGLNYQCQFIRVWNSIPSEIKQNITLKRFKTALTEHYLHAY